MGTTLPPCFQFKIKCRKVITIIISVADPDPDPYPYQETLMWIRVAPKTNQNHGINKSKWFVNVLCIYILHDLAYHLIGKIRFTESKVTSDPDPSSRKRIRIRNTDNNND